MHYQRHRAPSGGCILADAHSHCGGGRRAHEPVITCLRRGAGCLS
ncbi:hypothetical protein [Alloactinosynnema sp. L-07]|nr:hypothetical protein [Alloactinosynnema sp. L-07]